VGPQRPAVIQQKRPVAPPAYRPQPTPKVLQCKPIAPPRPQTPNRVAAPPAPRQHIVPGRKNLIQPKVAPAVITRPSVAAPRATPSHANNTVQRVVLFTHGPRLRQNNVAESIANMVDFGITKTTLNGSIYPGGTKENFISALVAPTLRVGKGSLGGVAVSVESVPVQRVSYQMELPTNGPWTLQVGAANVKVKLANQPIDDGVDIPIGPEENGDLTLQVRGLPTNQIFANLVETHEDVHVGDIEVAIDEILNPWDRRLSLFRNQGRQFEGMSEMTATARLYEAAGGTPRQIADRFVTRLRQLGMIFHNTDAGKAPSIAYMGRGGAGGSVLEVYLKHRAGLVALHQQKQEEAEERERRARLILARGQSAMLATPVVGSIQGPNGNAYINNDML
ncbi:MAG TPA: hypothetical protein VJS17_06365, partial [Pyrinomonadaceae bacterium]|nr:hypothetical protein [Pyrinomonadaceae bacterium]